MNTLTKWDCFFFASALTASRLSKDPSTKVGAAIENNGHLVSTGYNGFPKGFPDKPEYLLDRDLKIRLVEHAERNAISQALNKPGDIRNGSIYITHCPCTDCAKGIIQAGIKKIQFPHYPEFEKRWDFPFTRNLLEQCGVEIIQFDPEAIIDGIKNNFDIEMTFFNRGKKNETINGNSDSRVQG